MHKEFKVHLLNEQGIIKAKALADLFDATLTALENMVGSEGRNMSLVRTKLEEASFFAKKAMAEQVDNQKLES